MDTEIIDGILTFDEILEDDYYREEFEKRVQQRLDEYSHSDVKGGKETMDDNVQKNEGEVKQETAATESQPQQQDTPAVENPNTEQTEEAKETETAAEPAKEMTGEQFALYNETLRRISKTAKQSLPERYNAFEDAEVKAIVKEQVLAGGTPDIKEIAAGVVKRLAPTPEPTPQPEQSKDTNAEITSLKAENALLKAGIMPERIEAATKLFIAEGGDLDKVNEFVAKYPEWHKQEGDMEYSKAPPVGGKTAAATATPPVLNDFERKVAAARKRAGLD